MRLHLDTSFQLPPHLTGSTPPKIPPTAGDLATIKAACLQALDVAYGAGIFDANGCLTIAIQRTTT